MKCVSQITHLLRRGEAETNLCSHLMRMPQRMYRIEITCQEPHPADKATTRDIWWKEPLLNWEEAKTLIPRALHRLLNLPFVPRTKGWGASDPHVCAGAQVPQVPAHPPHCARGSCRAGWEVQLGTYFDHSRDQKLPVAEHRSQMLVLELINLAWHKQGEKEIFGEG